MGWNQEAWRHQVLKSKVVKKRKSKRPGSPPKLIYTGSNHSYEEETCHDWALFFRDDVLKTPAQVVSLLADGKSKRCSERGTRYLEKSKSATPLPRLSEISHQSTPLLLGSKEQHSPPPESKNIQIHVQGHPPLRLNDSWEYLGDRIVSPNDSMSEDEMRKFGMQRAKRKTNGGSNSNGSRGEQDG